ncbi:MAG TPA: HI0074 family nucleotidyltransferase substrate-binding subunit [Candidatus Kapabacteria bacterium]|nr:HI0074 family nucleotidyltransferase substrate-binding subunit [Candidatus Kapabacteria bacterium]HPO62236.1 HI0074 family nucleotidyltransferase substrate-binding subunit [Candidatus Kapabacteria bacterium]
MLEQDIRWKQRFSNFVKVFEHLKNALKIQNADIYQKAGMIQFFEMCFELAWNTLKDYLEDEGFKDIKSPRAAIKKAFEIDLIKNGHIWLKLLEDRNLTSHIYDDEIVEIIEKSIRNEYFNILNEFYVCFKSK